jgi:hypothetical protein
MRPGNLASRFFIIGVVERPPLSHTGAPSSREGSECICLTRARTPRKKLVSAAARARAAWACSNHVVDPSFGSARSVTSGAAFQLRMRGATSGNPGERTGVPIVDQAGQLVGNTSLAGFSWPGEAAGRGRPFDASRRWAQPCVSAVGAGLIAASRSDSRGDPESPLRWTVKSTRQLADALTAQGHPVSPGWSANCCTRWATACSRTGR